MPDNNPPQNRPVILTLNEVKGKNPSDAASQINSEVSIDETAPGVPSLPDEYDRRGIKLPARTLVGGIITPV